MEDDDFDFHLNLHLLELSEDATDAKVLGIPFLTYREIKMKAGDDLVKMINLCRRWLEENS